MGPLKQMQFPQQAHLLSLCSKHAYLEPRDGINEFAQLGFDADFIDVDGSQAYWLRNDDDLVIVCRGTQPTEFKDIAADLQAVPVRSSTGVGHVHMGFKESADDIWPTLYELANDYGKTRTVWCTGHSLGAAMATLLAYKLQRTPDTPNPEALFTYGSPRVGNQQYVNAITNSGLLHFRFVNNADIVARVPLWPFHHFGGMFYMNHWGNLRAATGMQITKDVWRGFVKGIKKREINFFANHSIDRYCENLRRWAEGEISPQEEI